MSQIVCAKCNGKGTRNINTVDGRPVTFGCQDCERTGIRLELIDKHRQAVIVLLSELEAGE